MGERVYLSDGAYATWDGMYVWVETDRGAGQERVALNGRALADLVAYAVRCNPGLAESLACAARTAP